MMHRIEGTSENTRETERGKKIRARPHTGEISPVWRDLYSITGEFTAGDPRGARTKGKR